MQPPLNLCTHLFTVYDWCQGNRLSQADVVLNSTWISINGCDLNIVNMTTESTLNKQI